MNKSELKIKFMVCPICDKPIPKEDWKKYGVGKTALCKKCYEEHAPSITLSMLRTVRREIEKIKLSKDLEEKQPSE